MSVLTRISVKQTKKNDCAITSLKVFEDITYEQAFNTFIGAYTPKTGTRNYAINAYMCAKYDGISFNKDLNWIMASRYDKSLSDSASGLKFTKNNKGISLKTFAKQYNKGKYYVLVRNHALVVDNGVILDSSSTSDLTRVRFAWKK